METTRRTFQVDRRQIHYIRSTLESYDGMALVRTLEPRSAVVEVRTPRGCEEQLMDLVQNMRDQEGITMTPVPWKQGREERPKGAESEFPRTFSIVTMGCQMNEYDSEYAFRILENAGFLFVLDPEQADIVVINTCSVRAKAEHKALSTLGRLAGIKKRRGSRGILVFAGCVAQQEGGLLLDRFPELDLVLGTRQIHRIATLVDQVKETGERRVETDLEASDLLPAPPESCTTGDRIKSAVTIMQGCNNFCSYCIVPYVRGREISRAPEEIVKEIEGLLRAGAREITLLGQNVNSYRRTDGSLTMDFPRLLRRLDSLPGLARLRFTTSHPKDLSEDLISCFGELDHLCGHIHLPFQAGSDRVLKRMNRHYTRKHYMDLVSRLRSVRPEIAITADVMVGFPGETREDFEDTLSLIRHVRFDNLYSFKYSNRHHTAASRMDDQVEESEKGLRLRALQSLQDSITLEKNRLLEGKEVAVLVEGQSKKGHQFTGRSECNRVVNFTSDILKIGDIVDVSIEAGCNHSLRGRATVHHVPASQD